LVTTRAVGLVTVGAGGAVPPPLLPPPGCAAGAAEVVPDAVGVAVADVL